MSKHTHPDFGGPGRHLDHDHHRGDEGHTHTEEIELVIARLLNKQTYTGLSPHGQRVVARGIAAMRAGLVIVRSLSDDTARRYPPPTTGELRAPLVNRTKGEIQNPAPRSEWRPSNTARCLRCQRQTMRKVNVETGVPYGPAVIFHADDCPDRIEEARQAGRAAAASLLAAVDDVRREGRAP